MEDRRPRRLLTAVPMTVVVLVAIAGLILISLAHWRRGSLLFAGALLLGGLFRLILPAEKIGPLAVRGKVFDVCFYVLGAGVVAAVAIVSGFDL